MHYLDLRIFFRQLAGYHHVVLLKAHCRGVDWVNKTIKKE